MLKIYSFVLFIFVWAFFPTLLSHAKPNSNPGCFSINDIVDQLPRYPEQLFFKDDHLRSFVTGSLGLTPFTVEQLAQLQKWLMVRGGVEGRDVIKELKAVYGATTDDEKEAKQRFVTSRRVAVAPPLWIQGQFMRREGKYDPGVDTRYRQGLPAVYDLHHMPIPNDTALAAHWASQPSSAEKLVGLTIISGVPGQEAARVIRFPDLTAKQLSVKYTGADVLSGLKKWSPLFALDPLTYIEEGITPDSYTQVRVDTETAFYPLHIMNVKVGNDQMRMPYPFESATPIRTFEMIRAKLRPIQASHLDKNLAMVTPVAQWTLGVHQSYEHPVLRAYKKDRNIPNSTEEQLYPDREGKYPSPFAAPKRVMIKLSYYGSEGAPRELFSVYLGRKKDSEDAPVVRSDVTELLDHLLEDPSEVLYLPGTLNQHHLGSTLFISGVFPVSPELELKFDLQVDTRRQVYTILASEIRKIEPQYIHMFRRDDFDVQKTHGFSQKHVTLTPEVIGASAQTPLKIYAGDVSPINSPEAPPGPSVPQFTQVVGTIPTTQAEMHGVIKAYMSRHLKHFKGFSQKFGDLTEPQS